MDNTRLSDTWENGGSYERFMGRWSRQMAPKFLSWIHCPAGLRWLDVGCGTGALSAAILDGCSPAQVTGVEPSAGFRTAAAENLAGRAVIYPGSAADIPLEPSSVDVVVSGLMLNFAPDPRAALTEMVRVSASEGVIGAYIWDYGEKMEFLRLFWEAAAEVDPGAAKLDEGARFPLCNPEALKRLFTEVGLRGIETAAIEIQTPFASFDDYWQPFLGGQGAAPAYVMALDDSTRARLRDHLRSYIPSQADGSISLVARAWAVRANVAK